ncbi:MAG: hypothetical protein ACTSYR_01895 [Candidatus Odinarchaeia archaeon]
MPLIIDSTKVSDILAAKSNAWVESFNPPVTNTLLLFGATYGFFSNVLQTDISLFILWIISALTLLFLVILPVTLKPKNKNILKFSIIALIFLFIAKGNKPPLGFLFKIIYNNFKISILLRDLHSILVIPALTYSILLGYSLRIANKFLKKKSITLIAFSLVILTYSWPFLTGNFGGYLQTYKLNEDYKTLYTNLKNENGDHRILWLPIIQPVSYQGSPYPGLDPMVISPPKDTLAPLISSDTPQEIYAMSLDLLFHQNITNNIKVLLDLAGIKYIIYRSDVDSQLPKFHYIPRYPQIYKEYNNKKTLEILQNQIGINKLNNLTQIYNPILIPRNQFERYQIYRINNTQFKRLKITNNNYLVTGGYKELIDLYSDNLITDAETIFFSSQIDDAKQLYNYLNEVIVKDDLIELITSLIPKQYKINIGKYAHKIDAATGWTPITKWGWYNWDFTSQLEAGAFTLTSDTMKININLNETGNYAFLIKTYYGPKASRVSLSINDLKVSEINTSSVYKHDFKWVYLTNYKLTKKENIVSIKSEPGENAVLRLIIIPVDKLEKAYNEYLNLLNEKEHTLVYTIKNQLTEPKTKFIKSLNNTNASFILTKDNGVLKVLEKKAINKSEVKSELFSLENYYYTSDGYFNNSELIFNITAPLTKLYNLILKAKGDGMIEILINDKVFSSNCKNNCLINDVWLNQGVNEILIKNPDNIAIKSLVFKQFNKSKQTNNNSIVYKKISNSEYDLNLKIDSNSVLLFSESFDSKWVLRGDKIVKSIFCNGFSNCFLLNKTNTNLKLIYQNQLYYNIGSIISFITFSVLIILLIFKSILT